MSDIDRLLKEAKEQTDKISKMTKELIDEVQGMTDEERKKISEDGYFDSLSEEKEKLREQLDILEKLNTDEKE